MVNSLWTNFLIVFRGELSNTGYSEKDVPIRTRPAFSNGPLCSIVSLKLRVRNYTLKFPFFFSGSHSFAARWHLHGLFNSPPRHSLKTVLRHRCIRPSLSRLKLTESRKGDYERKVLIILSRAWDKENSKSLPPFPPSPLSLQEDLASSKVSSVKELRERKFLGSVIDERDV